MMPEKEINKSEYKSFVNALFYESSSNSIELDNNLVNYADTYFSRFDEYLARLKFYSPQSN